MHGSFTGAGRWLAPLALFALPAFADDDLALEDLEESERTMETVVVTATRKEESLIDVAEAVSLVGLEEINRMAPDILAEMVRGLPGAYFQQTTPGQGIPIIRGLKGSQVLHLVDGMRERMSDWTLGNQMQGVIDDSNLVAAYEKEPRERMESRVENLRELVNAADAFVIPAEDADAGLTELQSFLSHAALEAGDTQAENWEDCVQMMTLHSAKGLEFPLVFICGMEDGLFPHQRSIADANGLEEERRLCYVGITRAMQTLYITYAEQRRLHGMDSFSQPSRFVAEIPGEHIEEVRPRVQVSRPVHAGSSARQRSGGSPTGNELGIRLGQHVRHRKFGDGVILNCEGQGAHARVEVNFETAGTKWLVLSYANLELM